MSVVAKLVAVDGSESDVEIKAFADLQRLVDGPVEFARLKYKDVMYLIAVNEDGAFECDTSAGKFQHPHVPHIQWNLYGSAVLLPANFDIDSIPYE